MGLFDKLKSVFIEEVEIPVDENGAELKQPAGEEPVKVAKRPETVVVKEAVETEPVFRKPETVINSIKLEPVEEEKTVKPEVKEEKKTVFINTAPVNPLPPIKKKEPVQEESSKPAYEFTPIISPIFGMSEKDQRTVKVTKEIKKSPIHNSSALGTVISPIYGIASASERASAETIHLSVDAVTKQEEEDITNISLEDMIGAEVEEVEEEDFEIPFLDAIHSNNKKAAAEPVVEDVEEEVAVPAVSLEEVKITEIKKAVEEEPAEEKTVEQKTAEIRKVMQQYKEEDLFEKENQPTLFDF